MTFLRLHARARSIWGLTALAAASTLALTACGSSQAGTGATQTVTRTATASSSSAPTTASSAPSTSAKPTPAAKKVHVSLQFGDGAQVGVGMPIIAYLSRPIGDAKAFAAATRVSVNGRQVAGGWYFERKYQDAGHPVEADYRLPSYWPAHAHIHMDLPVQGLSAGPGLVFGNSLTLDFATGAAHVLTVDAVTHKLTVMSDGKQWGPKFPVSLGAPATRTERGTKVIMEKGRDIPMRGPGYYDPHVKFTQRLTYGGEYLHSAPWNVYNITHGIDSSNGCTNLLPSDAKKLYNFLEVGDVVQYPNANGQLMQMGDGYGDWNVPWPQWKTGGLYAVS